MAIMIITILSLNGIFFQTLNGGQKEDLPQGSPSPFFCLVLDYAVAKEGKWYIYNKE